jgi:peptidoglycan/xylan/chitin deacetylase (PgdA/CDA1 family)
VRFPANHHDRRSFLGMLSVGLAVTISGCSTSTAKTPSNPAQPPQAAPLPATPPAPVSNQRLPAIPPPHPGRPTIIDHGSKAANKICLTVDDGDDADVVAGYVQFAQKTGIHLTFSPNGTYGHSWSPHAETLKPLIANGQVQLENHTYSHLDLRKMTDKQITAELERNEEWIQRTFGVTTRPYYRPPFGFHNEHIDGVAANLGYTRVMMWNGSYGDSEVITPQYLMSQAAKYLEPGVIVLGHANHPAILGLFDQIAELIRQRDLTPATLDEMFGTSRATG